jgi:hypothetical protein
MRGEATRKPVYIITVHHYLLQSFLKAHQGLFGLRIQPDSETSPFVLKKPEPGEFYLEGRDLPASHFELLSQNIEFLFWPKGIDQSDVGHPSS